MFTFLKQIFDKLELSLNFLNRENSPSNSATFANSSGNIVQQAAGDMHVSVGTSERRRPRLDIEGNFPASGGPDGYVVYFKVINDGDAPAIDITYYLEADDFHAPFAPQPVTHRLAPGEVSRLVTISYSPTDFYKKKLLNPRIILVCKDRDGNEYRSGRYISQESRADGNFQVDTTPGNYFEM